MSFAVPWMLVGLLALPALAVIYWLRSRARQRTVSSLFLWVDQRRARQGGRVFQQLQTPLTFFLELLAIAAMVLAAAAPSFTRSASVRPLVVVLDDSYSMQAGGKSSPRQRAIDALQREFQQHDYVARVILAGAQPRLLGAPVRTAEQWQRTLDEWTCGAPTAGLESAVALATEVGGNASRMLVVSDHPPTEEIAPGRLEQWSFGQPHGNLAFTAATRDRALRENSETDRVLLEVTNFGSASVPATLTLTGAHWDAPSQKPLPLDPGATSRLILELPSGSPPLRATLGDDALAIDNQVVLVSPRRRPVRVEVQVGQAGKLDLRASLVRALEATGQAALVTDRAELIVADRPLAATTDAWQLQILRGADPVSYEGPFVLDRSHPLAEGLALDAVIWSAASTAAPAGTPVLAAGNRVLIADSESATGRHQLQMAIEPELSSLTESPDWPILIANLLRWRQQASPGTSTPNVRLGQALGVTLPTEATPITQATLKLPDATEQMLTPHGPSLEVRLERTGLYQLQAGSLELPLASNALNADESDLSRAASGRWGSWTADDVYQDERLELAGVLVIVALACLALQMIVVARGGGKGA